MPGAAEATFDGARTPQTSFPDPGATTMTTTTEKMTTISPIRRMTSDNIRVTIEDGFLYLGFNAIHRKPLTPAEVGLVAEVVELCDWGELKLVVDLVRRLTTPGAILKAIEDRKNPPPGAKRRPRRGEIRMVRYNATIGIIEVEKW